MTTARDWSKASDEEVQDVIDAAQSLETAALHMRDVLKEAPTPRPVDWVADVGPVLERMLSGGIPVGLVRHAGPLACGCRHSWERKGGALLGCLGHTDLIALLADLEKRDGE